MTSYVLITRPIDDAQSLAAMIKDKGCVPFIEPMLEIVPLDFILPDLAAYQALVFTSANAVRVCSGQMKSYEISIYCVGEKTAQLARSYGWTNVKSAGGDVKALAELLEEEGLNSKLPLLHLAGQDIAAPLVVSGLAIETQVIYKAEQVQALSPACLRILEEKSFIAALFFSVRTAQTFAGLLEKCGRTEDISATKALCISDLVVRSLNHLPWRGVQASARPEARALADLLFKD